jgi:hypothetical protein
MKKRLCILWTVAICVISGCNILDLPGAERNLGENTAQNIQELRGAHYAKLNSIGCLHYPDVETAMLANRRGDFDTIDNLVREKKCFVVPTDKDIYITERVKGDIVSVKLKGSTQLFYTVRSSLVLK